MFLDDKKPNALLLRGANNIRVFSDAEEVSDDSFYKAPTATLIGIRVKESSFFCF